ncbi:sugar transferase [Rossellomorea sp. NRS-1567]|uniref:sugar transferase n=1 Tax=Rossellomorea sp. NRS-1567 TaxID=3233901 RepID=UPI003D2BDCD9
MYLIVKRLADIIFSLILLIVLFPFLILIGLAIKTDSKGPVLFKQRRIGLNGKEFLIYKFRTMVVDAENIGPPSTSQGDSRITKIGQWLRRFSIDEIPQLINVVKGDMSFIGPRPTVKELYDKFDDERKCAYRVSPGITGYAQVNGRSQLSLNEKKRLEVYYADNISLLMDIKILIRTFSKVVNKSDNN